MDHLIELEIEDQTVPYRLGIRPDEVIGLPRRRQGVPIPQKGTIDFWPVGPAETQRVAAIEIRN